MTISLSLTKPHLGVSLSKQQHHPSCSALCTQQLPPNPRSPHNIIKLILLNTPLNPHPTIPLEHHIPQQLLPDLLPEQRRDAPQVRDGDGPARTVREEGVGLVELAGVGGGRVVARVELEGADGEEGVVLDEALRIRVKDGDKL